MLWSLLFGFLALPVICSGVNWRGEVKIAGQAIAFTLHVDPERCDLEVQGNSGLGGACEILEDAKDTFVFKVRSRRGIQMEWRGNIQGDRASGEFHASNLPLTAPAEDRVTGQFSMRIERTTEAPPATFSDAQHRFTVQVPAGWRASPLDHDTVKLEPIEPGAAYVTVRILPGGDAEGVLGVNARQIAKQWTDFSEAERGTTPFAGRRGQYGMYRGKNPDGVEARLEMMAVSQGSTYLLTIPAPAAEFGQFQGAFDQIEDSFTLTERDGADAGGSTAPPTQRATAPQPPGQGPVLVRDAGTRVWSGGKEFVRLESGGISVAAALDKADGFFVATVAVANESTGTIDVLPSRFSTEIAGSRQYAINPQLIRSGTVANVTSALRAASLLNSCNFQNKGQVWEQNCIAEKKRQIEQEQQQQEEAIGRLRQNALVANTLGPSRSIAGAVYFSLRQMARSGGAVVLDIPISSSDPLAPERTFRFSFLFSK